jgi:hypothetical protein
MASSNRRCKNNGHKKTGKFAGSFLSCALLAQASASEALVEAINAAT